MCKDNSSNSDDRCNDPHGVGCDESLNVNFRGERVCDNCGAVNSTQMQPAYEEGRVADGPSGPGTWINSSGFANSSGHEWNRRARLDRQTGRRLSFKEQILKEIGKAMAGPRAKNQAKILVGAIENERLHRSRVDSKYRKGGVLDLDKASRKTDRAMRLEVRAQLFGYAALLLVHRIRAIGVWRLIQVMGIDEEVVRGTADEIESMLKEHGVTSNSLLGGSSLRRSFESVVESELQDLEVWLGDRGLCFTEVSEVLGMARIRWKEVYEKMEQKSARQIATLSAGWGLCMVNQAQVAEELVGSGRVKGIKQAWKDLVG